MKYGIILSIISILLLAGCFPQKENIEVLSAEHSPYELHLYTDLEQKEKADSYLSALVDWKTKQDDQQDLEFKQRKANSDQLELSKDQLPALVIKKEGKVVANIFGDVPREQILTELESSISNIH